MIAAVPSDMSGWKGEPSIWLGTPIDVPGVLKPCRLSIDMASRCAVGSESMLWSISPSLTSGERVGASEGGRRRSRAPQGAVCACAAAAGSARAA